MIEFDVETTGLQWYAHKMFLAQFLLPGEDAARVLEHDSAKGPNPEIQRLLDLDDDYRAWNSKFDLHFLAAAGYRLPDSGKWNDGMVLAHIIDERRSAALKARGESLFGPEASDDERRVKAWLTEETKRRRTISKQHGLKLLRPNYSDVPVDIMHPYAAGDVTLQRKVCSVYEHKLTDELRGVYELEMGVLGMLYDVEKRGLNFDVEGARAFEAQLERQLDEIVDSCAELAGKDNFNPNSGAQLGEALKRRGADLTFARTLKSGLPSTDDETLNAVDDDLARRVIEYRSVKKLYGTYMRPILNPTEDKTFGTRAPYLAPDGRIHSNFRQVGARTGRMSSSDPNVQNWHRDDLRMRHLVVASEGNKLVSSDLDSIELRLLAAFVGEGKLLEMMKDPDADLHSHTAKMIGLKDFDRGGGIIEPARQRGKTFNYSMIYGAGVRSLRKHFRVNQATAKEYLMRYHDAYPEVGEFQNLIEFTLADQGFVKTPWGRRHRCDDVRFVDREAYKFTNYLIQGTAADLIKDAAVKAHEAGIPIVAIVHDEILADVPAEDAEEAAVTIRECLIDHPKITDIIPLDADAKIVDRWSHAKDPDFIPDYERNN